jgi:Yip1 domain
MQPVSSDGHQAPGTLRSPVAYRVQVARPPRANSIAQFLADAARVLTRPSVASFDAIQSHARLAPVLLGVLLIGGAYAVAGSILTPVVGLFGGLLGAFLGFFSGIGMAMLVAKALGGGGRFTTYAYTIAIVDVPLAIVDAASLLVPPFTGLVFLLGIAYGSYLGILATASVHRLSIGKSVLVYLVSLLLKVFIPLCAIATIVVVLLYALASHQ